MQWLLTDSLWLSDCGFLFFKSISWDDSLFTVGVIRTLNLVLLARTYLVLQPCVAVPCWLQPFKLPHKSETPPSAHNHTTLQNHMVIDNKQIWLLTLVLTLWNSSCNISHPNSCYSRNTSKHLTKTNKHWGWNIFVLLTVMSQDINSSNSISICALWQS